MNWLVVKKRKNAKNVTAPMEAPGDIEVALWPSSDPNRLDTISCALLAVCHNIIIACFVLKGSITCLSCCRSTPLPGNTLNKDAWLHGHVLNVGGAAYDIILNPPTLEKVPPGSHPHSAMDVTPHSKPEKTHFQKLKGTCFADDSAWAANGGLPLVRSPDSTSQSIDSELWAVSACQTTRADAWTLRAEVTAD